MSRQVLRYTVVRKHPETDIATAILAGSRVPSWAKDLVDEADLTEAPEAETEEVEANQGQAPAAAAVEVPALEGEDLFSWVSESDDPSERVDRGNAVYLKEAGSGASEEELEDIGQLILAAVYRLPDEDEDEGSNLPPSAAPEPPRAGPGSGVEAWSAYAKDLGIEVPADAKRDDVIELVEQHSASAQD